MTHKKKRKSIKGWSVLNVGDMVDVVAPASKCSLAELEAGVKFLESWGLRVRVPDGIFGEHPLHATSDKERWLQLKAALLAPDSKAIWCVRGGYGSMKLLPELAHLEKPRQPKVFLGLSDITSLNVFFNQKWKWPVLHAPILSRLGRGDLPDQTVQELKQVLFGELSELSYNLEPLNASAQKRKKLEGPLVGGNWATIMASVATPFQLKPKGSVLFLEDVGERGYRLDRFWEQFQQMGVWDEVQAVILGDFTEGQEPDGRSLVWEVLRTRAASCKIPVYAGLPAGHGGVQRVLPMGLNMKLSVTARGAGDRTDELTEPMIVGRIPTGGVQ